LKFVDEAIIEVTGGKGGNGCLSFRREKFVPRGGPDGGDGGTGGNVVFRADTGKSTLLDFKYIRHYRAPNGENGGPKGMTGKNGDDLVIPVPQGTIVRDLETEEVLGDLTEENQTLVVAKGGRNGKGNARFVSSTNRAPTRTEPGDDGEYRKLKIELKLLADVALIGMPNAGKSTMISRISNSRPKIADYPFTTLVPNLGVVDYDGFRRFVVADVPGLIEDAHTGKGLGIRFLKHASRSRVLVHLVAMDPELPEVDELVKRFHQINDELEAYDSRLAAVPQIVALTKVDVITDDDWKTRLIDRFKSEGYSVHVVSAITGNGMDALLGAIADSLGEDGDEA
jgi:GTP-binding protein